MKTLRRHRPFLGWLMIVLTALQFTQRQGISATFYWDPTQTNLGAPTSWNTASNWNVSTVPNLPSEITNFTSDITATATVTLDGTKTVGMLFLGDSNNTNPFTIAQGSSGNLVFDNGHYGNAFLSKIQAGNQVDVISAPILLRSNLDINVNTPNATSQLNISGSITDNPGSGSLGLGLNIMGAGRTTLSGTAANTFTGLTTVYSRGFGNATDPQLVLSKSNGVNAIGGDLTIGNASRGGTGSAVVQLGANEQIIDTAIIRFDGSTATGADAYFKLMGFSETIGGISDYTSSGVIENQEAETVNTNGVLTINSTTSESFNGYIRNRKNGTGTGVLSLVKNGSGTQTLSGANITYTGATTINNGRLVLSDTTAFNSSGVTMTGGELEFAGSSTISFSKDISGTGSLIKSSTGDVTITSNLSLNGNLTVSANAGSLVLAPVKVITGSTALDSFDITGLSSTTNLAVGMPVEGTNIPLGSTITAIDTATGKITISKKATGTGTPTITVPGKNTFTNFLALGPVATTVDTSTIKFASVSVGGVTYGPTSSFSGNFDVKGLNTFVIIDSNVPVSGAVSIIRGSLDIASSSGFGNLGSPTSITIAGRPNTGNSDGILIIENNRTSNTIDDNGVTNSGRIGNNTDIISKGGTIAFRNNLNGTTAPVNFAERLGALNLTSGAFLVSTDAASAGQTSTLTFASLSRSLGATIDFSASTGAAVQIGSDLRNRVIFNTAPTLDDGIIGGWATVGGVDFATHVAGVVQALSTYDTGAQTGWTSTSNVKMTTTTTLTANRTINSLNFQGGTLSLGGSSTNYQLIIESGGLIGKGTISRSGTSTGSLTAGEAAAGTYDLAVYTNTGSTLTITAPIVDRSGVSLLNLVKSGSGTLVLNPTASNTYSGKTYINNGILSVGKEESLGVNPGTFDASHLILNGGTLNATADFILDDSNRGITVTDAGGFITAANGVFLKIANTIQAAGLLAFNSSGNTITLSGNNSNFTGGIDALENNTDSTINITGTNNTIGLLRVFNGTFNLGGAGTTNTLTSDIRNTIGNLNIDGTNNFTGTLFISAGQVKLNSSTALTGAYKLAADGGTFLLNGFDTTITQLSGAGSIGNGSSTGNSTLTINQSSNTNFSGAIANDPLSGGGTSGLNLVKNGIGNLTFNGSTSNAYSGSTTINEGTLTINKIGSGARHQSSGIGASDASASNLVFNGGALAYNGLSTGTTDRSFTLGVGASAGTIVANGASLGAVLVWGNTRDAGTVAFTGSGDRTLTLAGFNRGDNEFNNTLGDGLGGLTSLNKIGNGVWVLQPQTQISGNTTINSNVIENAVTDGLLVGQAVSGPGIPVGSTILSIDTVNKRITLSQQATVTGTAATLTIEGNTYSGQTIIKAGILATTSNAAFGTGTVIVGGGAGGQAVPGLINATLELRGVNYSRPQDLMMNGGTLSAVVGTNPFTGVDSANSTWAGNVTFAANTNVQVNDGAQLTLSGILSGTGAVTQLGGGSILLSGHVDTTRNQSTSASYSVQAGRLILDYTDNSGKLSDVASLSLGGSRLGATLEMKNGSHLEIVGSTTLNSGDNEIIRTSGTAVIRLNKITRNAGSTLNFNQGGIASTDNNNVNGILSTATGSATTGVAGWATVGLSDWATKSSTNDTGGTNSAAAGQQDGLIVAYTAYTNSNTANDWTVNTNQNITASSTQNARTVNTLRYNTPGVGNADVVNTLTGTNIVQTGGILITPNMRSSVAFINGSGTIATGAGNNTDLMVLQNNTLAAFEIAAIIANASGQTNGLDKLGQGNLILTGENTYTGVTTINNGRLTVKNVADGGVASALGAATSDVGNLVFNGGIFQYAGGTASTNRGFTINTDAKFNVSNENSTLTLTGQFATPTALADYVLTKQGAGTLRIAPTTVTALSAGYGITEVKLEAGRLQFVMSASPGTASTNGNNDRYLRSDISKITLGGGALEFVGAKTNGLSQTLPGEFVIGEGASEVRVTSQLGVTTSILIGDAVDPVRVTRRTGGTVLFVENPNQGIANIFLRNAPVEQNVVLPWAVYRNTADLSNLQDNVMPGVDDFALVASANNDVVDASSQGVYQVAASTSNAGNASTWNSISAASRYLSEGSTAFTGTTASKQSVQLLRYFNQGASTITIQDSMTLEQGAIFTGAHVSNNQKLITGGTLTSAYGPSSATNDLIVHNYNPATTFDIASQIIDYTATQSFAKSTSGSAVISVSDPTKFTVGTMVSGVGIPPGATVIGVSNVGFIITLSVPATQDNGNLTLTITKPVNLVQTGLNVANEQNDVVINSATVQGTITNGSNTITSINTTGLKVGMRVSGTGILAGATITAIDTVAGSITLSSNASSGATLNLNFSEINTIGSYQTGVGTTLLTGANTYTGTTFVQGGVLRLGSQLAIPGGIAATGGTSHIKIGGGVIGLGFEDFTRGLGSGVSQVEFTGSGGFAAYGADRSVNLGGAGAALTWGDPYFLPEGATLVLGAPDADKTINFKNDINLGRIDRVVRTDNGSAAVDAILSGSLTGTGGRLIKSGLGTLSLTGVNSYTGGTVIGNGVLVANSPATAFGSGPISLGTTSDSTIDDRIQLTLGGGTLANTLAIGTQNSKGVTSINAAADINLNGAVSLGRKTYFSSDNGATTTTINGVVSGAGGINIIGGGTVTLTQSTNNYGTSAGGPGAAINGGTIIRSGTVQVTSSTALGNTTVELGDSNVPLSNSTVEVATNGVSLTMKGGIFKSEHNGSIDTPGTPLGAFIGVGSTIDGVTLVVGNLVLVKDEGGNPERNGVYQVISVSGSVMNLVRVTYPDSTVNPKYGTRVTVANGTSAGSTYFMASDTVVNLNRGDSDPSIWLKDAAASNVSLLAKASNLSIANAIDVNANGAGTSSLGTTDASYTGVTFSGGIVLQNVLNGVSENKTLTLTSADTTSSGILFSGVFSEADGVSANKDTLSLLKSGLGVVTLSNANSFHGTTTVQSGTLRITNADALGYADGSNTSGTTVNSGATLEINGTAAGRSIGNEALALSGTGVSNNGALHVVGGINSWAGPVNLVSAATIKVESSSSLILSNTLSGSDLNKDGAGTLILAGTNTYANTNITAGTLQIGNGGTTGTLGSGSVTDNALLIFNRSNTLVVGNDISGSGAITQSGSGTTILTGTNSYGDTTISSGTLQIGNGGTTGNLGTGSVTNNSLLSFVRSDSISVGNSIAGTGSLLQAGSGTTTLTGANTYAGQTQITGGVLSIGASTNLGNASTTNNLAISSNGVLRSTGASVDLGVNRTVAIGTGGAQVDVTGSNSLAISGTISGASTDKLTKTGSGTLIISGTNTYAGGTSISSGTLLVNNTSGSGTGTGSVTVNSGATLGGNGAISTGSGNSILVQAGAILSVGGSNTAAGFLNLSTVGAGAALTFTDATSFLKLDIMSNSGAAGSRDYSGETTPLSADRLIVSGVVNLNGVHLQIGNPNLISSSSFTAGDTWKLFDWTAVSPSSALGSGSNIFTVDQTDLPTLTGSLKWDLSKLYTTGQISVTSVPEPSRFLLCLFAVFLAIKRRRRSVVW